MNAILVEYGLPAVAVILAALISGIFAKHTTDKAHAETKRANDLTAETTKKANELAAQAAEKAAMVAARQAEADMRDAIAAERDAAAREWARMTEGMQRWNESLQADIKENARRIDEAELRSLADRERADRNERLYSKAIIYLRRLIRWIDDVVPGENYPPIPQELNADL